MLEKVTIRINNCLIVVDWNGRLLDLVSSSKFRASLVPAAAVIPAELGMDNIVAVKTSVVTIGPWADILVGTKFTKTTPRLN